MPKEVEPEATKPIKYDGFYINKMAVIRDSSEQIDFSDLTYIYQGEVLLVSKVHYIFLKIYIMTI